MKDLVKVLKALSDVNRLKVVKLLEKRDLCVCELQFLLELSQPAVSHHLKVLSNAGLIDSTKDGLFVNYRLSEEMEEKGNGVMKVLLAAMESRKEMKGDLKRLKKVNRDEILSKEG